MPIGILTGLLVFIPYVGFGLGLVLGVLAALLQWHGWPHLPPCSAVYGVGQMLEGYVLVPWLVGDRIGLHPLAVIFALLAFGQLFGFAGVLLALPVSAVAAGASAPSARGLSGVAAVSLIRVRGTARLRTRGARAAGFANFLRGPQQSSSVDALSRFAPGQGRNRNADLGRRGRRQDASVARAAVAWRRRFGSAAAISTPIRRDPRRRRSHRCPCRAICRCDRSHRSRPRVPQARLFTLYNAHQAARRATCSPQAEQPLGRHAAARRPAHALGWGLVYEVLSFGDDEKPAALAVVRRKRGFRAFH